MYRICIKGVYLNPKPKQTNMNQEETAHNLIKQMSQYTTSVTKKMTFDNAKECALICACEVRGQYELDHDPQLFLFWDKVVRIIRDMKLEIKN